MTSITATASTVFRAYNTDGVPSTGNHEPDKNDTKALFALVDGALTSVVDGIVIGGAVIYSTLSLLNGDLAHAAGVLGVVYADGTPSNDGIYVKSGSSGSGAWTITPLILAPAAIAAETAARISADTTEATTRAAADTALTANLAANLAGTTTAFGAIPPTTYGNPIAGGYSLFADAAAPAAGTVGDFQVWATGASAAILFAATPTGGNTFTNFRTFAVNLHSGVNDFRGWKPILAAGDWVGIWAANNVITYDTSGSGTIGLYNGLPIGTVTTTASLAANSFSFGFSFECGANSRLTIAEQYLQGDLYGEEQTQGPYPATGLSTHLLAGYTAISLAPIAADGVIDTLSAYMYFETPAILCIFDLRIANTVRLASALAMNLGLGLNTITTWRPNVRAGQYVGIYTVAEALSYQTASGANFAYFAGAPTSGVDETLTVISGNGISFGWSLTAGAIARENSLEDAFRGVNQSGLGVLGKADSTGIADATAVFASGYAIHPKPYVPPGTFAITALPDGGDGFWGPGAPMVAGYRRPISAAPRSGALSRDVRSAFSTILSTGAPFVVIGDSIQTTSAIVIPNNHQIETLYNDLNNGVAPGGYPVCSYMDGGTTQDAWFGFVQSSGVTGGSNGPVQASAILPVGEYLEFIGIFASIGVFYVMGSGLGGIELSYSSALTGTYTGTVITTISTSAGSTSFDNFTLTPTGQTTNLRYRLTARTAGVEISGLDRRGVKTGTAPIPPALNVLRATHGGWATFNFTNTLLSSAMTMAQKIASGTNTPSATALPWFHIALGTNDMLEENPSMRDIINGGPGRMISFATNLQRIITEVSTIASKITLAAPARWYEPGSWSGLYEANTTFEGLIAVLQAVAKTNNVPLLRLDKMPLYEAGMDYTDNLHPVDIGAVATAQIWYEFFAAM